ncbi:MULTISPECIES: polysaccharide deacetylase family protein [unclassified Frankia]|uniref:polysaccharide deacetylase family protein n=1 Tax=unclassified Frankia TaxID=2632575 RepID=UPI0020254765
MPKLQPNVPITVFAAGQWPARYPDLAGLILQAGHELDNHTCTHPALTELPASQVSEEITACRDVLARLAPGEGRYFRPSGTSQATPLILTAAGAAGYRTVVDFDCRCRNRPGSTRGPARTANRPTRARPKDRRPSPHKDQK